MGHLDAVPSLPPTDRSGGTTSAAAGCCLTSLEISSRTSAIGRKRNGRLGKGSELAAVGKTDGVSGRRPKLLPSQEV